MKQDHRRVHDMLLSAVTMLCKNGLNYDSELKVEGLIGITIDNKEVFLVHVNENIESAVDNTQYGTKSEILRNVTPSPSPAKRKHSSSRAVPNETVLEIAPSGSSPNSVDDSNLAAISQLDCLTQTPPNTKKRRNSKSNEHRPNVSAEENSHSSSVVVIKDEPQDEDSIVLSPDTFRQRIDASETNTSSNIASFTNFSGTENDLKPNQQRGNHQILNPDGVFITGFAGISESNDIKPAGLWDSSGGSFVAGPPVVAGTSAQDLLGGEGWSQTKQSAEVPGPAQTDSPSMDVDLEILSVQRRCTICFEAFDTKKVLGKHYRRIHGGGKCKTCNKKFKSKNSLERHREINNHNNLEIQVACENCGNVFPNEKVLKYHREKAQTNLLEGCRLPKQVPVPAAPRERRCTTKDINYAKM